MKKSNAIEILKKNGRWLFVRLSAPPVVTVVGAIVVVGSIEDKQTIDIVITRRNN